MTVCIAALCDVRLGPSARQPVPFPNGVLCISDRMLTSSALEIEFEPAQKKIYDFGHGNTIALVAGDTSTTIMLCDRTRARLGRKMRVADVAATYASEYVRLRQERNERKYLAPLGLATETFAGATGAMSPVLAMQLANDLRWEQLGCEALICGTDLDGAHIYVVRDPGQADCADVVGFAAIGVGQPHAETILMDARYTRDEPLATAMLLLYTAKRRAEVAPGVGAETDVVVLTPFNSPPRPVPVSPHIVSQLGSIYDGQKEAEVTAHRTAREAIDKFLEQVLTPPPPLPGIAPSAPEGADPSPTTPDSSSPLPSPGSDESPSPAS